MVQLLFADGLQIELRPWLVWGVGLIAALIVSLIGRFYIRYGIPSFSKKTPSHSANARGWGGVDRRVYPRISINSMPIVIATPDSSAIITTGTIIDKSLGGLGLEVQEAIPNGERFRLRMERSGEDGPWALLEVRYCRPKGIVFRMGRQFIDISEWDVMELLGPPEPEE